MMPMVAKVTTTAGCRLHLDKFGNAHCGAGTGRTIGATAKPLADASPDQLCRRCIKAIRVAASEAIADHAGGGHSQYRTQPIGPLCRLREQIRTPQEKAEAESFREQWRAAQERRAKTFKPSAFALIKQRHAEAAENYCAEQAALFTA